MELRICISFSLGYLTLFVQQSQSDASNSMSLGEHFGAHVPERAPKSPNWISEEMIKSISLIYCELAQPPLMNNHNNPSPISPLSSMCELSSQDHLGSMRNYEKSFNSNFGNPFHIEEFSVPYCTMLKVQWISRERKKDSDINHMLQGFRWLLIQRNQSVSYAMALISSLLFIEISTCLVFRSLIYRLKEVDLKAMKHEEKLAFWINVHNTLVMHVSSKLSINYI